MRGAPEDLNLLARVEAHLANQWSTERICVTESVPGEYVRLVGLRMERLNLDLNTDEVDLKLRAVLRRHPVRGNR